MIQTRYIVGDVLEELRKLPANLVQTCVTSPPYYGMRDYGLPPSIWGGDLHCQHDWQAAGGGLLHENRNGLRGSQEEVHGQTATAHIFKFDRVSSWSCSKCQAWKGSLGLEPTPQLFVAHLVEVFNEVRRVLRPDGTVWLNLGDSFATSAGRVGLKPGGGRRGRTWRDREGPMNQPNRMPLPGLKPKDLIGVPWRVALALQEAGWWLRCDVIWNKPNPNVESAEDRPTRSHEYIFLLTRSRDYFYDNVAVREVWKDHDPDDMARAIFGHKEYQGKAKQHEGKVYGRTDRSKIMGHPGVGRNLRTVWKIACRPYKGAHFATFPPEIPDRAIRAGTSARGACPTCGAPWRRVSDVSYVRRPGYGANSFVGRTKETGQNNFDGKGMPRVDKSVRSVGWVPTCDCPVLDPVPCVVLDPFAGSGTTLMVATNLGRSSIGIDLNIRYRDLARRRVLLTEG